MTTGGVVPLLVLLAPRASTEFEESDCESYALAHAASNQQKPPIAGVTRLVFIATFPFARAGARLFKIRKWSFYASGAKTQ
jgi:hypothetical protein